ncbi:MAG: hypothetical protein KJ950_03520 [Proteobacteria bacterium]|nr:hypothetical protein [Pseudomonadota bacterium]MBU1686388.1 hypothetical protein [Pseudomonadota bacterium]
MRKLNLLLLSLLTICISTGCIATQKTQTEQNATASTNSDSAETIDIPASSPFAKIKMGMGSKQVLDLIGPPGDQQHFTTGKSYIPFYYGKDTGRWVYYYKNHGRLVFGGNDKVVSIDYDPKEDGYK